MPEAFSYVLWISLREISCIQRVNHEYSRDPLEARRGKGNSGKYERNGEDKEEDRAKAVNTAELSRSKEAG